MKPIVRLLVISFLLASASLQPIRGDTERKNIGAHREALLQAAPPLNALPGPDRIVILPGKTYLNGWVGYGEPPRRERRRKTPDPPPLPAGPQPAALGSKESGPGTVTFADAKSAVTTATFSAPGTYVLKLTADNGESKVARTLRVEARAAVPLKNLHPVLTKRYTIDSPLWNQRAKALIVNWIPHVAVRIPDGSVSELYQSFPEANGVTSIAVNGKAVRPAVENGYAVIKREWKAGDRIDLALPLKPQRVRGSERIEATRGRVALKYGPLVYNIEQADQDITRSIAPDSALTAEWNPGLLGGVVTIKGTFANDAPLLAIPSYARNNRGPVHVERPPAAPGARAAPRPPTSIVWIREQR